jgi:type I restriction enzyme S subunit
MIDGLKPYPAYKDSGVPWLGQVPEHWEVKRGKALFRCIDIRSQTGEEDLLTVSSERGVVPRRSANVTMFKAESYIGYKLCWPDDLVINSLWAWARGLGVSPYHGIVSSAYGVYRLRNTQENNPRFIHQLVRSVPFQWELQGRSKGIWLSRLQLTDDAFLAAPFPMPPSHEQTAIVRFLDYMDWRIRRVIHARQRHIKLLEEYRQALTHQAVTGGIDVRTGKPYPTYKDSGVPWLGQVPEHWEVQKLKYAVTFVGGGTPSKTNPSFWEGQIPWVSPKDMKTAVISNAKDHINDEAVAASSTSIVGPGSVLLVVRSGILRRSIPVAINLVPVALNQDMKALRPKHALLMSGYLRALIQGNQRRLLDEWTKQGATVESIEHEYLANSHIPLPPLPEQTAIVEYLDAQTAKIDTAIASLRRKIELVREYRERLIADVVTGKVDVREVAARLPEEPQLESELTEIEVPEGNDDDTIASSDVSWET